MLRKPKTYETITAGLRDMMEELAAHAEELTAQATNQRRMAERLHAEADASDDEANRALFTADKLSGLLS